MHYIACLGESFGTDTKYLPIIYYNWAQLISNTLSVMKWMGVFFIISIFIFKCFLKVFLVLKNIKLMFILMFFYGFDVMILKVKKYIYKIF